MDNDLISRAAVIRAIRNHINVNRERADRGYAAMIREEDIEIIEQLPSAERVGEWQGTADGYWDGELVYDIWNCSECGYDADGREEKPDWDFCPNCGARMYKTND